MQEVIRHNIRPGEMSYEVGVQALGALTVSKLDTELRSCPTLKLQSKLDTSQSAKRAHKVYVKMANYLKNSTMTVKIAHLKKKIPCPPRSLPRIYLYARVALKILFLNETLGELRNRIFNATSACKKFYCMADPRTLKIQALLS